jgi:hypothetical protein
MKNMKTKSSAGLALPFLANWLAGAFLLRSRSGTFSSATYVDHIQAMCRI